MNLIRLTLFIIKVRSPAGSSSSGVGGKGRLGGPPPPPACPLLIGVAVVESSETGTKPGLNENSGLNHINHNNKKTTRITIFPTIK